MVSEMRLLANRLNAKRSTGPKTAEGKARSRRNALKHGLAGRGIALPQVDENEYQDRIKAWTDDIQPQGAVEEWLAASATLASVRVDRCKRVEAAEQTRTRHELLAAWEEEQEELLKATLPENIKDLGPILIDLEQFSTGCEWLANQWRFLRGSFRTQGFLDPDELGDLLTLLQLEPDNVCVLDTREYDLAQTNECARSGDAE